MELLPTSVAPFQLMAVPLALAVMSIHVLPPLSEPNRVSPDTKAALSVALMVWAALLVMKSMLLPPLAAVSTLRARALMLVVGAVLSSS